jgi:preprotein translocase subunit SecE
VPAAAIKSVLTGWRQTMRQMPQGKRGDVAESNRPGDRAVDADLDDLLGDEVDESGGRGDKPRGKAAPTKDGVAKSTGRASADKGPGIFARIARFFREIVAELRKVIWPTRKELLTYTAVVVVFVAVVLTVVGLLDYAFARAMIFVFGGGSD